MPVTNKFEDVAEPKQREGCRPLAMVVAEGAARGEGRRPQDADLLVTGYTEPQAKVCPG